MKPLAWIGTSLEDLRAFPHHVQHEIGIALTVAQCGGKHPAAKPLRGFGGAQVLEVVEDMAIHIAPSTPSALRRCSMYCIVSRKIDAWYQDHAARC
jgi:hypothetical protein